MSTATVFRATIWNIRSRAIFHSATASSLPLALAPAVFSAASNYTKPAARKARENERAGVRGLFIDGSPQGAECPLW